MELIRNHRKAALAGLLLSCSLAYAEDGWPPDLKLTGADEQKMRDVFYSLGGISRECADGVVGIHIATVFSECENTDWGKAIDGGCHHIAGSNFDVVHNDLYAAAMTYCGICWKQSLVDDGQQSHVPK